LETAGLLSCLPVLSKGWIDVLTYSVLPLAVFLFIGLGTPSAFPGIALCGENGAAIVGGIIAAGGYPRDWVFLLSGLCAPCLACSSIFYLNASSLVSTLLSGVSVLPTILKSFLRDFANILFNIQN